ncbi:MAG: sigma-70 family RNA polymerase sigma factor [Spirosomataceae bacterium]
MGKRNQINPDLNFSSYLFTCLRNLAFDYFKKMEKSQAIKQHYYEKMGEVNNDETDIEDAKIVCLREGINSIRKRKIILKLNIEEGKSYQEIAELMKISKNTVKNQLVKAKQFLRGRVDLAAVL